MNFLYLIILLAIIDLQDQFKFVYLTAFIQFSSYSLIHANYFFLNVLKYFFDSSFIVNIIGICVYLFYFELYFIYELYFFIMIIVFLCSLPVFFFYINYKKVLANDNNKKKLHNTFKISIKLSIIIICVYENNFLSYFFFFLWVAGKIFECKRNKFTGKFGSSDQKKKETIIEKTITEKELDKLHKYFLKNKSAVFKSTSKKRYFILSL